VILMLAATAWTACTTRQQATMPLLSCARPAAISATVVFVFMSWLEMLRPALGIHAALVLYL
jgi:hypothetical protein